MGWDGRGREAKEGRRRRGRGRQAGRRGSPFNILIVLLTQWNEISWRNARAITQNHSSVRHAVRPPAPPPALSVARRAAAAAATTGRSIQSACNACPLPVLQPPSGEERAAERAIGPELAGEKDEEDGER